jgi:hypothetical protein
MFDGQDLNREFSGIGTKDTARLRGHEALGGEQADTLGDRIGTNAESWSGEAIRFERLRQVCAERAAT